MSKKTFLCIPALAAYLILSASGCPQRHYADTNSCSVCHLRSFSCHIQRQIEIQALRAAWERSFHKSLLKDTFDGCPHLQCKKCHQQLKILETAFPPLH